MRQFMQCLTLGLVTALLSTQPCLAAPASDPKAPIHLAARAKYLQEVENRSAAAADALSTLLSTTGDSQLLHYRSLPLKQFLQKVASLNPQVQIQKTDWDIKQAEEDKTHAIFEPEIIASISLEENSQKNTIEESLSRASATTYSERNWDYSLAVQGFAPTGAKYNLGYNLRKLSNSVTKSLVNEDQEYQMFLGINLTQPLLKNAGIKTTKAGIHAAEANTKAAFHDYRLEMMKTLEKASEAYWNFYQAQEKLKLREDSIRIAKKILEDNRERHRTGKMAEIEVYEAMAGVASRSSLLSEAEQEHLAAANELRSVLAIEADSSRLEIMATPETTTARKTLNMDSLKQKAFSLQPEYLATQARLEQTDIKVAFAKNQRWPELDLQASYGLNGLDFDQGDSWDQVRDVEYDSWSVGMEFRMPLLGGIESRSELRKVQLEKKRQLLTLKDLEIKLKNRIDTAAHNMASAHEQLEFADEIVTIQKKLLEAELARLQSGKSNSRLVLEKEDNYRNALEVQLKNRVNLQNALTELQMADGSILLNTGVEILEREI